MAESEMVQRVAEALRKACREQFGTDWSYDVAFKFARAAIEEMREPTQAMIEAPYALRLSGDDFIHKSFYQAMIDEVLNPSDDDALPL